MRYAAALAILIALIPACGTQQQLDTTVQAAAVRTSLDSLWAQYAVAADRRDSLGFASIFFDDATLVFSNAPTIIGRSAIEDFLVSLYTPVDVTGFRVIPDDLRVHGPLAVETGRFEEVFTEAGTSKTEVGRFVLVAETDRNKSWKIRRLVALADSMIER